LEELNNIHRKDPKQDFKWPVTVSQLIQAPGEEVWKVISMPGNLEPCHPFCLSNPVHKWSGEGSKDEIHYLSGWTYEREFGRWIDGEGYDLEIGRAGGGKSFVSWRIQSVDNQNSILKITVCPHVLQDIPVILRWIPHYVYIQPLLTRYLKSVTKGFEWYISNGTPVPRDHFGKHPWFSSNQR
jgi:hypothetical protein